MDVYEFLLDFSGNAGIPSQHKIELKDVTRMMHQQLRQVKDVTVGRHYHRGCFAIQTGEKKTADILKNFRLELSWHGKTYRVPMRATSNKPEFWVQFYGTGQGRIANLPNSYFDEILEAASFTIVRGTEKRTHGVTGYYTRERSARVTRGERHAERNHEWHDHEGNVYRWRLQYQGQPFQCFRGCGIFHEDGRCKEQEEKKEKRAMAGQQKCFFASSSMLRLCSDTKTTRIDAIPGARVGHVANHVSNDGDLFRQAEVVAIHAGSNMDYGSPETSKPHLEAQAQELEKVVKPLVDAQKKVFFIDPVAGKIPDQADSSDHWKMVRKRMRKVAQKTNSTWISLNDLDWVPEEDVHTDHVHYSVSGTKKIMEKVREKIKKDSGIDVMEGMDIVEKPYSGLFNRHYKFGCYKCTRVHDHGACPPLPDSAVREDLDSSTNSVNSSSDGDENTTEDDTGNVTDMVTDDPIRRNSISVNDDDDDAILAKRPTSASPSTRATAGKVAASSSVFSNLMLRSKDRSISASKRTREETGDSPDKTSAKDKKPKAHGKQGNGHGSRHGK